MLRSVLSLVSYQILTCLAILDIECNDELAVVTLLNLTLADAVDFLFDSGALAEFNNFGYLQLCVEEEEVALHYADDCAIGKYSTVLELVHHKVLVDDLFCFDHIRFRVICVLMADQDEFARRNVSLLCEQYCHEVIMVTRLPHIGCNCITVEVVFGDLES